MSLHKFKVDVRVFDYIRAYLDKNTTAPTFDEIATGCWLSPEIVAQALASLEAQGLIRWNRNTPNRVICLDVITRNSSAVDENDILQDILNRLVAYKESKNDNC